MCDKSTPLYRCDPNKNVECKKRFCGFGKCKLTIHKEFSTDGIPIDKTLEEVDMAAKVRNDAIQAAISAGDASEEDYETLDPRMAE